MHNADFKNIFNYNGLSVKGYSRGGFKTCFYIPELKVLLDANLNTDYAPDFIFISHSHSDHIHNLPMILLTIPRSPKTYAPK